jgi:hypothetical protein
MANDNGKLEKYLAVIHTYYREIPATYEEMMSNAWMPDALQYLLTNKERLFGSAWTNLVSRFREMDDVHVVKDMSFDSYNCCKVLLSMNVSNFDGIGIYLSLTGKFIGVYYCSLTKESPLPVTTMFGIDNHISYTPFFNSDMAAFKTKIVTVVKQFFPEYEEFDNAYAGYQLTNIQLQTGYHKTIDLFQAIFDINLHSLI